MCKTKMAAQAADPTPKSNTRSSCTPRTSWTQTQSPWTQGTISPRSDFAKKTPPPWPCHMEIHHEQATIAHREKQGVRDGETEWEWGREDWRRRKDWKTQKIKREKKANGIKKNLFCFRIELLLHLESHRNTIPNFFGIVAFYKFGYRGYFRILC